MFENRYERNIGTFTPEENEKLQTFRVCAVGCGGLGGYVIEEDVYKRQAIYGCGKD